MKKYMMELAVKKVQRINNNTYGFIIFEPCHSEKLPEGIQPGQFVQIDIPDSKTTFLRRPISINFVYYDEQELWLLVRNAGPGTERLINSKVGEVYNMILPLGHGFTIVEEPAKALLVGGGIGVAPLLFLAEMLTYNGAKVTTLYGVKSEPDVLLLEYFSMYGSVYISTEDGSLGEKGLITQNSVFDLDFDYIACCGPTPMMKAVAKIAAAKGIECEVSLENMMACGLGACLCCVEDTQKGNVCVCTEGPVFNIKQLKWEL